MKKLARAWIVLFWTLCVAVPLGALLARAFDGSAPVGLWDPAVIAVARATVWQAGWSTLLSAAIGFPLGLWAGKHLSGGSRAGRWAQVMLALPFGVPTVVAGLVWVSWLGKSGLLARWGIQTDLAYSLKAVILAHVFYNAPWIALLVAQARAQVPPSEVETASTLGARTVSLFRFVMWPRIRWALASGAAQVFGLCSMSFALVLLLGGGPPVETLETALYGHVRYGNLDLAGAVSCALWELLITLVPWIILTAIQNRSRLKLLAVAPRTQQRSTFWSVLLLGVCGAALFPHLIFLGEARWNLLGSPDFLGHIIQPIQLTLLLAVLASILVVLTAAAGVIAIDGLGKWTPGALALLGMPAGISVLVLGLGFWLAYGRWIDPFEGSLLAMVALQTTLFFPLAFRSLWPVAQGTQRRLLEAAATLGASPVRAFLAVEWPRWRAPILSSLAIVAGASVGEVAAVSLFYSERLIPLPLIVTRWMNQYRFEEAQLVAAILFVLSVGLIASMTIWKSSESKA